MANDGSFSAVVTHADGETVVRLSGELDMATAPDLAERLAQLSSDGRAGVIIDVSELEFCDSSGLAVFVEYSQRARAHGTRLVLRSPSPRLRVLLELTHLEELLG
jgi:anti-sigma B factor antagonist